MSAFAAPAPSSRTGTPPRTLELMRGTPEAIAPRMLVVDDDGAVRSLLERFFVAQGYEVHTADCAEAALSQLARADYALLICDIVMPGLTGLELVPRALANDADLAVIILTALNDAPTATKAFVGGASG